MARVKGTGENMSKRLFAAAFAAALMIPLGANAQTLKFAYESGVSEIAAAVIYNENKELEALQICNVEIKDGICTAELDNIENKTVRLFFPESKKVISEFIAETPNKEDKNSAYPTEYDAVTAYMMVKDAGKSADGDEIKTKLTVFCRGEERELLLDEDMTLYSAPEANSELTDTPVSGLKPGDIIYCATNLSGKVRTVELIYRPVTDDIMKSGEDYGNNFEKLYTTGGKVTKASRATAAVFGAGNGGERTYAFGLIRDLGAGYMTLSNKGGLSRQNIDIDITPDTIVYVYDKSKKNGAVRIGDISDITKSGFDAEAIDNNDNVIDWSKDFEHNYALVRMSKGTAMEIALYLNYK